MTRGVCVLVAAIGLSLALAPAAGAKTVWLCKPGLKDNPCTSDETATVLTASGSSGVQHAKPARKAPIDCFYVYPTVSSQTGKNANLNIDPEERAVAMAQASRLSQDCRIFAPMYRQVTIGGLFSGGDYNLAYNDVLSAWRDYLAHFNHGRGVVLLSHSQGSLLVQRLLREQIDNTPRVRKRLVSAIVPGWNLRVPKGRVVGGDLAHLPGCTRGSESGCVVAYSSFNATPPVGSLFGRTAPATFQVLCVTPAALSGDHGALLPYFPTSPFPGTLGAVTSPVPQAPTPWAFMPKLYTAKCMSQDGATWLQINDVGGPSDPRPRVKPLLGPTWGLHLADLQLPSGNLVKLVKLEARAYLTRHHVSKRTPTRH